MLLLYILYFVACLGFLYAVNSSVKASISLIHFLDKFRKKIAFAQYGKSTGKLLQYGKFTSKIASNMVSSIEISKAICAILL